MPTSAVARLADPYAFQAAITAAEAEAVFVAPGPFRATLTTVELGRLCVQHGSESLARTRVLRVGAGDSHLFFLVAGDQPAMLHNGVSLVPGEIAVLDSGSLNYQRSLAPCDWGMLSLASDGLAGTYGASRGNEMRAVLASPLILRPPRARWLELLGLCATARRLAAHAPALLARPEIARDLQQGLEHAAATCLASAFARPESLASRHHRLVMARLEDVAAASPDRPLDLGEICRLIGVPERTLRLCCKEQLGMGPIRYLRLRRMQQARYALERADPSRTTVTEVAIGHGFWELGRFSVAYRMMFGESPSAALHRDRRTGSHDGHGHWV